MSLGAITLLEAAAAQGPVFHDRVSIVGDDAYPTGGTADFQAAFRTAIGANRTIIGLVREADGQSQVLEYDHANDKLLARVGSTWAEVANATDLSGNTYKVLVLSK